MSSILSDLKAKMLGEMTEDEKKIKAKADAATADYETNTGEVAPEEPGIEPDYTIEDTASMLVGGPAAQMGKRLGGMAINKAGNSLLSKMKEEGPRTVDINSTLRKASPRAQDYFINTAEGQKALREGGLKAIEDFDKNLVLKTRKMGQQLMGAKSDDQMQSGSRLQIQKKYQK